MKTVSVDTLCNNFSAVEAILSSGEEISVTKAQREIARMRPAPVQEVWVKPEMPDFLAQMKEIFGDKVLPVTGAQIISEDRDDC
jgi:antitoxin (DNA-binding transcriptional repressor) of toxin-antitoxin stability system